MDTPMVTAYQTEWGFFIIPDDLVKRTKWTKINRETLTGRITITEPKQTPENKEFFDWLHAQEVAAGKPQ